MDTKKKHCKQAVLLVHGIGEQRPMGTIRNFVNAVFLNAGPGSDKRKTWIKPEPKFPIHELRRITTSGIDAVNDPHCSIRTDFFELYWQDLMRGSRISHVTKWLLPLLLRWPWNLPSQLIVFWVMVWALFPVGGLVAMEIWAKDLQGVGLFALLLLPGLLTLRGLFRTFVADAARYFDLAPRNVGVRNAILNRGVDLLEQIQADSQYDRVIVVGHSLGSAIAYDVLSIAWSKQKRRDRLAAAPDDPVGRVEGLLSEPGNDANERLRRKRSLFHWLSAKEAAHPWKVSDFVTLGSPLAHAALLLARNENELNSRIKERYLPTDPPFVDAEDGGRFPFCFPDRDAESGSDILRLHHAALFAGIRWTNLYVPVRWLFSGDVIGGAIDKPLGAWVENMPVDGLGSFDIAAHVHYWSPGEDSDRLQPLRDALDLERSTF